MNGVIYAHSSTRLAAITDGTSNTLMFGEHLHGVFDPAGQAQYHGWNSGFWTDTMIDGYYPVNASHKLLKLSDPTGRDYIAMSLASNHPGGANVALCDGSVRFLKDSIDCWPIDPATQRRPRRALQCRRHRPDLDQPRRQGRRAPEARHPELRRLP